VSSYKVCLVGHFFRLITSFCQVGSRQSVVGSHPTMQVLCMCPWLMLKIFVLLPVFPFHCQNRYSYSRRGARRIVGCRRSWGTPIPHSPNTIPPSSFVGRNIGQALVTFHCSWQQKQKQQLATGNWRQEERKARGCTTGWMVQLLAWLMLKMHHTRCHCHRDS